MERLSGVHHSNFRYIGEKMGVALNARGDELTLEGDDDNVSRAESLLSQLIHLADSGQTFTKFDIKSAVRLVRTGAALSIKEFLVDSKVAVSKSRFVIPRNLNQQRYIQAIRNHDLVFGTGPAGTGKTYLAVAMAVALLNAERVRRIVLTRPAVETGERLGFLPGTLSEKIDPYLRPLYDALYDLLDAEKTHSYIEQGVIEIAPLAFMRGRTLNDAFIILDEAQNTTAEQMKMFLTRLGFNSQAVITGDVTQIDLPHGKTSGLVEALEVLKDVEDIAFLRFDDKDVVRHPLVQKIVVAYGKNGMKRR